MNDATLSIGAVSKATGIPSETLRTWERRYGFPSPQRTSSGHRKYTEQTVDHLRLVSKALDQGHKPADVLPQSEDALKSLLGTTHIPRTQQPHSASGISEVTPLVAPGTLQDTVDSWLELILELDADTLQRELEQHWFRLGPMMFIEKLVAPLLNAIGNAWYEGTIAVIHERFASNQLRTFLSHQWMPLSQRSNGPTALCATLPGEFHAIGLHLIAIVAAISGYQVLFLGCDNSPGKIITSAQSSDANIIMISISGAADAVQVKHHLQDLQQRASAINTPLLTGGQGAPKETDNITSIQSLQSLQHWLINHKASADSSRQA